MATAAMAMFTIKPLRPLLLLLIKRLAMKNGKFNT
jgi:hypothetical protein